MMRWLSLMIGLCAVSLATAQDSCDCTTSRSFDLWGRVEYLSLTPHMRGIDYAASETGDSLVLGSGRSHEVRLDRDAGLRVQLGAIIHAGWGIDFAYTHFGTEGHDAVTRPGGTGQLFATFSHPGGPEEADFASAGMSLDYDVFDIAARFGVVKGCNVAVDLFAGFRWADINHELRANYSGRDFVNGVLANSTDVNAFGIRTGADGRWHLNSKWSAFATTSLAAMYGEFNTHRFESNINGSQVEVDFRDSYTQPIFNIESSIGLSYMLHGIRLSGGYEMDVWTNLGDSLRFVDDIEEGGLAAMPGDLLLEGFFLRIEKTW